jgi:Mce-associated membrane protein
VDAADAPWEHPQADEAPVAWTAEPGRVPRLLVGLVVVLLMATAALTWWAWPVTSAGKPVFESDGKAALTAAKADAKLVLAYDYRHLEDGFRAAVKVTTDADGKDCPQRVDPADKAYEPRANCFRSEYTRTHQKVVVDLATRYKTVVIADVGAGGVVRVSGDQVVVLLYVNQQSTSTQSATPKITQSRVEMTMQRVSGRWLVAGIRAL